VRRIVFILLLLALPAVCSAEIYKWIDEKGEYNFADDLGKVPKKYRDKVLRSDKPEPAVEVLEKIEPENAPQKTGEPRGEPAVTGENKAAPKAKPLYGGKDGESWKRDFARQKYELKSLEEQHDGIRERMANPDKMSRGEYLSLQNTVRDLEVRIEISRKKLQSLSAAADRAEVPEDFR